MKGITMSLHKTKAYRGWEPVLTKDSVSKTPLTLSNWTPTPLPDNFTFVKAWMRHTTVDEVAFELGLNRAQVSNFAHKLRKLGVELPKKNKPAKSEIAKLNDYIKKTSK